MSDKSGLVVRLKSLKVLLGVDSPEVRGWSIAVRQAAQKTVNDAIAALTAQPNTQRLLDALSIAQDAIMECLKYPEMPPEVIEQADERRLT